MIGADRALRGSYLGTLAAALLATYGLVIAANLSLAGTQGGLPSLDRPLVLVLLAFAAATDLSTRVAGNLLRNGISACLLAVLVHYLIGALRSPADVRTVLLQSHLVEIVRWSSIGFLALCGARVRLAVPGARAAGSIRAAALAASAAFWVTVFLIARQGQEAIRTDIFLIVAGEGAYYQLFGDYYVLAAGIVLGLQVMWFRDRPRAEYAFPGYVLLVALQGVASFFLLQLFGSNKAPVVVILMCGAAVLVARPVPWLFRGFAIRRRAIPGLAVLLATLAGALFALGSLQLPPLRILGIGEDAGGLASTSITSRNEFILEQGGAQLQDSPLLGNPSLGVLTGDYLHSSVLSVQTHLGAVGTVLLGLVLLVGWRRVRRDLAAGLLRVAFWPILAVSAISSFFSWGPLWFVIGGIVAASTPHGVPGEVDPGAADTPLPGPAAGATR